MMLDFIPKAIALGAIFATDSKTGILLAIFISKQYLPEFFGNCRWWNIISHISGYRSERKA